MGGKMGEWVGDEDEDGVGGMDWRTYRRSGS